MQSDQQDKFILTPIINILQDTVTACAGIGYGIETQSLAEYVLQTTFLKMTGASEQKLKCICWELATNDYGYRYRYLKKNYGECSAYEDKSSIYKDLIHAISGLYSRYNIDSLFNDIDISEKVAELIDQKISQTQMNQEKKKKRKLTEDELKKMTTGMKTYYAKKGLCDKEKFHFCRVVLFESIQDQLMKIVNNSPVVKWEQHNYINYKTEWKQLSNLGFAEGDTLLCRELQDFYIAASLSASRTSACAVAANSRWSETTR